MTQQLSAEKSSDGKMLRTKTSKGYLIVAFFLPMLLLGIGFVLQEVHPFGDRQILVTDFWHQYYPFLRLLHEKLQNGESLLYTWDSGLGTNFLAMMAYYAASPLNFLTLLVPDAFLRDAVTVVLLLKVGFAGLFFALFLKGTFHRDDASICIFSILYALCSYILGYYWNIIWMDTVALLPLVVLGLVLLVRDGKYRLYVISLGLSLLTNFYIGLFTCVFAVIAYLCLCVFYLKPRLILGRTAAMAGFSLLGAALAAVLLLPAYFALQLTHSVENVFPTVVQFYESWRAIFANMISFHAPTAKEGLPNLACGMLPLVLIGPFLRSGQIRIREKVAAVLVLAFLIISCNCNILNYIWHGFHFPNMLPYRFSFLFSFVLLTLGYRAFQLILENQFKVWDVMAMLAVSILMFLLSYYDATQDARAIYWSFAVAVLYTLILLLSMQKILTPKLMYLALSVVLVFEVMQNVKLGTEAVSTSDYQSYPTGSASVSVLLEQIDSQEEELFYRTEVGSWYTLNDPALYGYHGVSQFSSTANESVTKWMRAIGLPASEAGNRYYYSITSPFTDWLTGTKYLLNRNGSVTDTWHWEQIGTDSNWTASQNRYSLPVGFWVNEDMASYVCNPSGNPFENQNELFRLATGIEEPLFTAVDVRDVSHIGLSTTRSGYGHYYYQAEADAADRSMQYNYQTQQESLLYGYMTASNVSSVTVSRDDIFVTSYNISKQPYIFPLGRYQGNETASLRGTLSDEASSGTTTVYVYELHPEVFEAGYEKLAAGGLRLTSFSDTKISGTMSAVEDGLCYFSIPSENGWSVKVDGERVEVISIGDAMLAVPVTAGAHTITLTYCPKGFVVGLLLTVGSIAFLFVLFVVERKRKKPLLQPIPATPVPKESLLETKETLLEESSDTSNPQTSEESAS